MKQLDNNTSNMYLSESDKFPENLDPQDFKMPGNENSLVTSSLSSGKQYNASLCFISNNLYTYLSMPAYYVEEKTPS